MCLSSAATDGGEQAELGGIRPVMKLWLMPLPVSVARPIAPLHTFVQ